MSNSQAAVEVKPKAPAKGKIDYSLGPPPVQVNPAWCKACNLCIALCPKSVLEPDINGKPVVARAEDCSQCGFCWTHCPDFAIASNYR